jgi:RNA polymerase sigma-70 factor (ECF subfamily)
MPDAPAPVADEDVREATRATYAILAAMDVDERIAFALRFIDGMELTEVAEACGVSLATIKRRLARAETAFAKRARENPALESWLQGGARWAKR